MDIKNLEYYPHFNDGIYVLEKKNNHYIVHAEDNKFDFLSPTQWIILKLINGKLSIKQILEELSCYWEIDQDQILEFLTNARERGMLSFSEQPIDKPIKYKDDIFPRVLSFVITDKCNLDCIYCYGEYNKKNNLFFPADRIENVFSSISSFGIVSIELTGGEPLLHPSFVLIVKTALTYFKRVSILTNGVIPFNEEVLELYRSNPGKLTAQFSIDGCTEKTTSEIRGVKNTCSKTLQSISRLARIGISLRVIYMLTYENRNELIETLNILKKIGVKDVGISIPDSIGRGSSVTYPDNKPLSDRLTKYYFELERLIAFANEKFIDILNNPLKITKGNPIVQYITNCGAGWKKCAIYPDGDIVACQIVGKSLRIGNILDEKIETIFSSKNPIIDFLSNVSIQKNNPMCKECRFSKYCGNCLVKIMLANLELLKENEGLCHIAKQNDFDKYINNFKEVNYNI